MRRYYNINPECTFSIFQSSPFLSCLSEPFLPLSSSPSLHPPRLPPQNSSLSPSLSPFISSYPPPGFRYAMSRLIPPQFDSYGTTFWIPSQVEPAVALIGTSLPAIRQSLTAPPRSTKLWTSWWSSRSGSGRTSTSTSTNTTAATAGAAAKRGAGERAPRPGPSWIKSPSEVSDIELRSEYERLGEGV